MNDFIIRKVYSTLIDVFWGEGFDNWVRLRYHNGRWNYFRSNKTPPKELYTFVNKATKE